MFLRLFGVVGALVCASGCATLQEMPPPTAGAASSVCAGDARRDGQQAMLCDTVRDIRERSRQYVDQHTAVARERTAVQGATLVGALAGGTLSAVGADDDTIQGVGLLAASGLLLDRGLNIRARIDILRSGALSMNCFAGVGVTFANAYSTVFDSEANGAMIVYIMTPRGLTDTIESLSENLALARNELAKPAAAGAPDAAARTALTQAVTQGQTVLADLIKAQRAMSRAPDELERSWRAADTQILNRLAGTRPDLAALVREAQQLSASIAAPSPAAGAAPTGARGQGGSSTIDEILAAINADIASAERIDPGRYIAAFEQIGQCKALAAA